MNLPLRPDSAPREERGSLLDAFRRAASAAAARVLRRSDLAEDVASEALLRSMRLGTTPAEGRPKWLPAAARRLAVDHLRTRRAAERAERGHAAGRAAATSETADLAALRAERERLVRVAVEGLPEPYRAAVRYRYLDELDMAEVARRLGVPERTARTRVARGVARLRGRPELRRLAVACLVAFSVAAGGAVGGYFVARAAGVGAVIGGIDGGSGASDAAPPEVGDGAMTNGAKAAAAAALLAVGGGAGYVAADGREPDRSAAEVPAVGRGAVPGAVAPPTPAQIAAEAAAEKSRNEAEALRRRLADRDAAFEKLAADLKAAQAQIEAFKQEKAALAPQIEALGRAAAEGARRADERGAPTAGPKTAAELADLLGLDPARQAAFAAEFDRIKERMKELEKKNAKVTRDGDAITIEIPAFGADGDALVADWNGYLDKSLSPAERDRYGTHKMEGSLFPMPPGSTKRLLKIAPEKGENGEPGGWRVDDQREGGGNRMHTIDGGDSFDAVAAPFRYLLN